jgi:hypothetical protein
MIPLFNLLDLDDMPLQDFRKLSSENVTACKSLIRYKPRSNPNWLLHVISETKPLVAADNEAQLVYQDISATKLVVCV